jgi:hypothetical protein
MMFSFIKLIGKSQFEQYFVLFIFGLGRGCGKVGLCSPFYPYFFLAMIHINEGKKLDVSVHAPSVDPPSI